MPTDALRTFRAALAEAEEVGFERLHAQQVELGTRVRASLAERGFPGVAADGFGAPGVVVSPTDDPDIESGRRFAGAGVQVAGGVPLRCDEGEGVSTFRVGLDKLADVERTVEAFERALDGLGGGSGDRLPARR